jgi:hypothetical protein
MANNSTPSPLKPYQQIIASGSGAVLTALFMTLDIHKTYSRSENDLATCFLFFSKTNQMYKDM